MKENLRKSSVLLKSLRFVFTFQPNHLPVWIRSLPQFHELLDCQQLADSWFTLTPPASHDEVADDSDDDTNTNNNTNGGVVDGVEEPNTSPDDDGGYRNSWNHKHPDNLASIDCIDNTDVEVDVDNDEAEDGYKLNEGIPDPQKPRSNSSTTNHDCLHLGVMRNSK